MCQGMDQRLAKVLYCDAFKTAKVLDKEQVTGHLTKLEREKAQRKCFHTHLPSKNRVYGNHLAWKRNGSGILYTK